MTSATLYSIKNQFKKAENYSQKNIHYKALNNYSQTISKSKENSNITFIQKIGDILEKSYRMYCYHTNELGQYKKTIEFIHENDIQNSNLFFDWVYFYGIALLNLKKEKEYNKLIKETMPSNDGENFLKEVLLSLEGERYFLCKNYKESLNQYLTAGKNKGYTNSNRLYYYKISQIYYKLKDYQQAISNLIKLIDFCDTNFCNAYILLMKIYIKINDLKQLEKKTDEIKKKFFRTITDINDMNILLLLKYLESIFIINKRKRVSYVSFELSDLYYKAREILKDNKLSEKFSIQTIIESYKIYINVNSYIHKYELEDLFLFPKKILNKGKKAFIYKGTLSKEDVAIKHYYIDKSLKNNLLQYKKHLENVFNEISTLETMKTKYILKLKTAFLLNNKQFVYIITPLCRGNSLYSILHSKSNNKNTISIQTKLHLIVNIAKIIIFLHSDNNVYLNLSSKKFLFPKEFQNKNDEIVLSNLKIKTPHNLKDELNMYSAPELYGDNPTITKKADIYSFGILMWEILSGKIPFENMEEENIINVKKEGYFPPIDDIDKKEIKTISQELISYIMQCFELNIDERPDLENLIDFLNAPKIK